MLRTESADFTPPSIWRASPLSYTVVAVGSSSSTSSPPSKLVFCLLSMLRSESADLTQRSISRALSMLRSELVDFAPRCTWRARITSLPSKLKLKDSDAADEALRSRNLTPSASSSTSGESELGGLSGSIRMEAPKPTDSSSSPSDTKLSSPTMSASLSMMLRIGSGEQITVGVSSFDPWNVVGDDAVSSSDEATGFVRLLRFSFLFRK